MIIEINLLFLFFFLFFLLLYLLALPFANQVNPNEGRAKLLNFNQRPTIPYRTLINHYLLHQLTQLPFTSTTTKLLSLSLSPPLFNHFPSTLDLRSLGFIYRQS